MKTKIKRSDCSKELKRMTLEIKMSEEAFFDLAFQKHLLVKLMDKTKTQKDFDRIEGLLNLLDHIQDSAVEFGFKEECVFPIAGSK